MNEQNVVVYIHMMEYYLAIKINGVLITCHDMDELQKPYAKRKKQDIRYTIWFHLKKISRKSKL